MSNPYYTNEILFIPRTIIRSDDGNAQFNAIEQAFDDVHTAVLLKTGGAISGNLSIGGTLGVTGVATFTAKPILSSLTASRPVFSDVSKGLVSVGMTGTGDVVLANSPTINNLTYTGTLTGGTGEINIGNGQLVKTVGGNIGIGAPIPTSLGAGTIGMTINGAGGGHTTYQYGAANTGYVIAQPAGLVVNTFVGKNLQLGTVGVTRLEIDTNGNAALGLVPSSWGQSGVAFQFGPAASGFLYNDSNNVNLGANAYFNSGWKYQLSGISAASRYLQSGGVHAWFSAPPGAAGDSIAFAQDMVLQAGSLLLNETVAYGKLTSTSSGILDAVLGRQLTASVGAVSSWNVASAGDNLFSNFSTEAVATLRGSIDYNRAGGLVRYNTTSDGTLKNIKNPADLDQSLALIMSIPLDEWAWKHDENQWSQIGPVAQKLHSVFPGAVSVGGEYEAVVPATYDEDGNELTPETTETRYRPWAVDKTAPVWHLVATCQKQQGAIQDLITRVGALETTV